jgi:hypothetical protein
MRKYTIILILLRVRVGTNEWESWIAKRKCESIPEICCCVATKVEFVAEERRIRTASNGKIKYLEWY